MFADTFFNSNFYKDIKSEPLFWIMRRFWMEDFIHTNGAKILGVKKVADSLDIKDSLAYYNNNTLNTYQDQVQLPEKFRFSLENGRFCRTFALPHDRQYSEEQLANAISGYIALFDEMLKDYLDGKYASLTDMENRYVAYLNGGAQII